MQKLSTMEDDLKRYFGLPPHESSINLNKGCQYFRKWMERTYGLSIGEMRKLTGVNPPEKL